MIYSIPVQYTNTIYSRYVLKNTGGDPILQLYAISNSSTVYNTRLLFAPFVTDGKYTNVDKVYLQCWVANADLVYSGNIQINIHELLQAWDSGYSLESYNSNVYVDGSSWLYASQSNTWDTSSGYYDTNEFDTQSRTYRNIYTKWQFNITDYTQSAYGFLLKLNNENINLGQIYLYSSNTNTLFYPRYTLYINDYAYVTPTTSIQVVSQNTLQDYIYSIEDIQYSYINDDIVRFNININPKSYHRDWTAANLWYFTDSIVVTGSVSCSYAIYDVSQLQRIKIIDHSQYTKISCDGTINYFNFDMHMLELSKYYQFELKIGNRYYLNDNVFKIN